MIALLIDIGNSRIKWRCVDTAGRWEDQQPTEAIAHSERTTLPAAWQIFHPAREKNTIGQDQYKARACDTVGPIAAYVANVAGDKALRDVRAALPPGIAVSVLTSQPRQCGVINGYRNPAQLGVDRWAALLGARALYPDRAVLIASLGTATTIDLLRADGCFAGGVIFPGSALMRAALARNTAQLPLAQGRYTSLADNTDDAIDSGILHAQAGAIERMYREAGTTCQSAGLLCVLTGGDAAAIAPLLPFPGAIEDNLVMRGLFEIARSTTDKS